MRRGRRGSVAARAGVIRRQSMDVSVTSLSSVGSVCPVITLKIDDTSPRNSPPKASTRVSVTDLKLGAYGQGLGHISSKVSLAFLRNELDCTLPAS